MAWGFTVRKIHALLRIIDRRHKRLMAEALGLHALAGRGDGRAIENRIKDLLRAAD